MYAEVPYDVSFSLTAYTRNMDDLLHIVEQITPFFTPEFAVSMNFNDINTWPGWLEMGDQPGNYVSRGFGRKLSGGEGMPVAWRQFMQALYPEESRDLVGAIAG